VIAASFLTRSGVAGGRNGFPCAKSSGFPQAAVTAAESVIAPGGHISDVLFVMGSTVNTKDDHERT
jgi:hypothetical protein